MHTAERAVEEVPLLDAWLASCYPPGSANVQRLFAKHGGTFSKPFLRCTVLVIGALSEDEELKSENCGGETFAISPL